MLRAVALVPSPPLLVPELTGRGSSDDVSVPEADQLRAAALAAASVLGAVTDRWIALGSAERTARVSNRASGSFAGFGVDVAVALSPTSSGEFGSLPLAALVAGWLRGEAAPTAAVDVLLVGENESPERCVELGRALRTEIDAEPGDWGLLVVADGATTLTAKAPGSFDARAEGVQQQIDDALADADRATLLALDRDLCRELGVAGLPAWQALAGVIEDDPASTRTLYRGAPFGVGYFVGTWEHGS